jgi:O-antigen ligase
MHPGYLAMYINFSTFIACFYLLKSQSKRKRLILILLVYIYSVGVILLSSKSGIFIQLFTLLWFCILFFKKRWSASRIDFYNISIAASLIVVFGFLFSGTANRMGDFVKTSSNYSDSHYLASTTSGMRYIAWSCSMNSISDSWLFGYGTGSGKGQLINEYSENGYYEMEKLRLNSHNQYLETWLNLGIPGLLLLVILLISGFVKYYFSKDAISLFFILLVSMNMMVESILEVAAGVIFFGFFYSLFVSRNQKPLSERT